MGLCVNGTLNLDLVHLTVRVAQPRSYLQDIILPPEIEYYVDTLTEIADALGVDNLSFSS